MNYSKVSEEREKLKFEDTNMALFGTDIEYKVKKNAAEKELAWEGTRTKVGLSIWRIEKFKVVEWPKSEFGRFYDGDSYIVLNTTKNNDKLIFKAFMWIGQYSSQDEYGTAAYKIVELDDYLDRKATLYREVQGYENEEFLSIFNNKLFILNGGIESGFIHVEKVTDYPGVLFHVRRNDQIYRVSEVPLKASSLNNDDCFVLDKGCDIYIFFGETSSQFEKFKTATLVKDLRESRTTIKTQTLEVNGLQDLEKEHVKSFWNLLGGTPNKIEAKEKSNPSNDSVYEKKLFKCSDHSGVYETKFIKSNTFGKSDFDSNDAFIIDTKDALFYWIGNKASHGEKKNGFSESMKYIKENNRPSYLSITIISEGAEPQSFFKLLS